jgi:hypothetical protein
VPSKSLSEPKVLARFKYIERRILLVRGQRVMLDSDLAELYGVFETKVFNQALRRHLSRFPHDFMFQLTGEEASSLRSQIVTLEKGRGRYSKYRPFAFTEHGVAMLSSVLRSERAVQMNILIIRAFIALGDVLATHKDLARKMRALELRQLQHGEQLAAVYTVVKRLMNAPEKGRERIGFAQSGSKAICESTNLTASISA